MKVLTTTAASLLLLLFLSAATTTSGFTVLQPPRSPRTSSTSTAVRQSTEAASAPAEISAAEQQAAAATTTTSVYERMGVKDTEVALGIDPEEVFRWIGTRDDLVAKIENDNPNFDRERAEMEASKFMMDAEMLDAYIRYEKRKADPASQDVVAEQSLSDPRTLATYAAFVGGGAGLASLKNLHFDQFDIFHHATDSATAAADAAQHVIAPDAVQSTLEGVAAAVNNAVTCAGDSCP